MKKFLLTLLFPFFIALLGGGAYLYYQVDLFLKTTPTSIEEAQEVIIEIEPGMGLSKVSDLLQEENIITDSFAFKILARYKEVDKNIQAGRFAFSTAWTPEEVLDHLISGKTIYYRLTIREGLPWWEVAKLLESEGYTTYEDFKNIIHQPDFLLHWGIPFENAEGFLYPDTYFLPKPKELDEAAAKSIASRLIDTFWQKTEDTWKTLDPTSRRPSKENLIKYTVLASIIEKETGVSHERARVAGVYTNRLKKKMKLQADPTVAYGEGENFKPPLLYRHLDNTKNPYNTYQIAGLPPGPICSPSLASLQAALNPEEHNFLYFVAKGSDGSHYFAKTLREHNNNVKLYRKTQK